MTPAEFRTLYLPEAAAVSHGTGIDPDVLLAQWGVETAWGASMFNACNLGNIRCLQSVPCVGGFAQFPDLGSFCLNCIAVWHNGMYGPVLAAKTPSAQLLAIGQSPWDAGHYNNGGGPGSSIVAAYSLLPLGGNMAEADDVYNVLVKNGATLGGSISWLATALADIKAHLGGGTAPPADLTALSASVGRLATAVAVLDGKVNRILKELNTP